VVRSLTARVHSRTPGALETIASCTKLGITVNPRVTLRNDASSFKEAIRIVQDSHVKVLIFFGQQSDGKKFFLQAVQRSFLGPGVTAITADAFNVVLESNLENDYGVSAQQLRGTFGLSPDRGKGTPRYDAFSARFKAQPSTAGSVNGTCHPGVDADGGRLFAKDHDEDPTTPDVCTGVDFAALTELNSYSGYAYDAVLVLAHAAHTVLARNASLWWDPANRLHHHHRHRHHHHAPAHTSMLITHCIAGGARRTTNHRTRHTCGEHAHRDNTAPTRDRTRRRVAARCWAR
jgi:hypothetical protein